MSDETKEVANETTSETKPAIVSEAGALSTSFEVRSKGYQETFTTLEEANKQVDILRKRAIKKAESVSIKVFSKKHDEDKQHLVRNIKIGKSFFDN